MKEGRARLFLLILVLLLAAAVIYALRTSPPKLPLFGSSRNVSQPGFYKVLESADGDTIVVDMGGTSERVRLVGVDTPETHHPDKPVQCFGQAASDFTSQLLSGKAVRLESDKQSTNRDRYDRLLRYVYTESGELLNKKLITEGYGFAYTSFPFDKSNEFRAAEDQAKQNGAGLWSSCKIENSGGYLQTVY